MEPELFRVVCRILAVALLVLIIVRRWRHRAYLKGEKEVRQRLHFYRCIRTASRILAIFISLIALLTALHFPMDVAGPAVPVSLVEKAERFYEEVYTDPGDGGDSRYIRVGKAAAHHHDVQPQLRAFVENFGLQDAKTLEVGAGSGSLQDVVAEYTGLDLAASAARYFHKPFVQGSASKLPFGDSTFDLCWSIWTFEHVPNPEQALREIRRVTRSGGYLYLQPVWNNPTWASKGYPVRPDSELSWFETISKYSLLVREMPWFKSAYRYPIRLIRLTTTQLSDQPTRLRYHELDANFETYWVPDSDAVNSIDCYAVQLWFRTRGDEIVNSGSPWQEVFSDCGSGAVIVRVNKG